LIASPIRAMLQFVAHYVITIDGAPERVPDRNASERRLVVTNEDGQQRSVSVGLSGQGESTAHDDDAAWRAAVFFAAEEVELAIRGEGWGIHLEGGAPLLVTATADSVARFVGEPSAGISLEDGAVVGEFGL
jgi:hypothetical protein